MNDKDFKSLKEITVNELKMHNHLKNHYELSDKKCLFRNIRRYCQAEKINEQEIIPRTYHIDSAKDTLPSKVGTDASLWLVKPGEDTNRGTGITIERNR